MDTQNFRTAMRGFQKDDVIAFIETQTLNHEKELRAKGDELTAAHSRITELEAQLQTARQQISDLETQIDELTAPAPELEAPMAKPAEGLPTAPTAQQLTELELTAYRRAELAERRANERAAKVYHRLQTIFDESVKQMFEATQDLDTLRDTVSADLQKMEQAVLALGKLYQSTSESFREVGQDDSESI